MITFASHHAFIRKYTETVKTEPENKNNGIQLSMVDLPVNSGIVRCLIGYFDNDSIIFLSINNRPREHSIDSHHIFAGAKFSNSCALYLHLPQNKLSLISKIKRKETYKS